MHLTIRTAATTKAPAHARSASLPCQHSHPVLARLYNGIHALRSWSASALSSSLAGQSSGIALVDAILSVLGELLQLPQAVVALHDASACNQILERFLVLADAYSTFQSALVTLKQGVVELQVGTRCGDSATIAASVRAHRRTEKELCRLVATMRHTTRCTIVALRPVDARDSEMIDIMAEVAAVIMDASGVIFSGSVAIPGMIQKVSSKKWLARLGTRPAAKKAAPEIAVATLERLEQLQDCIGGLERGSEKVFRRLLQSRVSLLNIHNPF